MPSGTRKSKCNFRRSIAPEPISASELDAAERIVARFVATAYAAENPDLFTGTEGSAGPALSAASAVPLVHDTALAAESDTI
jgi:hypothetical protein